MEPKLVAFVHELLKTETQYSFPLVLCLCWCAEHYLALVPLC